MLEFAALMITVWLSLLTDPHEQCPRFLALSNNTSTVGWQNKANIYEGKNKMLHRKYAETLMNHESCLYSQYIKEVHNNIADALC